MKLHAPIQQDCIAADLGIIPRDRLKFNERKPQVSTSAGSQLEAPDHSECGVAILELGFIHQRAHPIATELHPRQRIPSGSG